MEVEQSETVGSTEYQGKTYYFCCDECKKKFNENPAEYAGNRA